MSSPQVAQTGIIDLLMNAGLMAKLVLLSLFGASVFSWAIIIMKWRAIARATEENTQFLNVFWHGKSVDDIYAKADRYSSSPVAAVFKSGFKELKKLGAEDGDIELYGIDNVNRALMRASNTEITAYEKHIGWLATTASAAPFVGLFGTVWGIMNSFQNIGATGAANLAVVAPGISEALVATAAGIGTAIPAVIAYNHFAGQIKRLAADMDCFTHDFLNIIQRSTVNARKQG